MVRTETSSVSASSLAVDPAAVSGGAATGRPDDSRACARRYPVSLTRVSAKRRRFMEAQRCNHIRATAPHTPGRAVPRSGPEGDPMHAAPHPFVHDALVRERRQTALAAAGTTPASPGLAPRPARRGSRALARGLDRDLRDQTDPRPGLHWPMLPWIYVRAAACAATNHAPLDPSAIMDQQARDRRAQAQTRNDREPAGTDLEEGRDVFELEPWFEREPRPVGSDRRTTRSRCARRRVRASRPGTRGGRSRS